MGALTIIQRRSGNGSNKRQLDTLRSLGLRRIGHTVQVEDCPQARGMLHAVRHLVEVQADGDSTRRTTAAKGAASGKAASE
jgi:large subunit ribosomal protein L30